MQTNKELNEMYLYFSMYLGIMYCMSTANRAVNVSISRTNGASVGTAFKGTRKLKVLSLPETTKEKSSFRAKALRREVSEVGRGESSEYTS